MRNDELQELSREERISLVVNNIMQNQFERESYTDTNEGRLGLTIGLISLGTLQGLLMGWLIWG